MLGVFLAELFREGKTVYFIIFVVLIVLLIFLACLKFVSKNKLFEKLWSYNKFFVVCLVSIFVGFGGFFVQIQSIQNENNIKFSESQSFVVSGQLTKSSVIYENEATFFLEDVYVSGEGKAYKLDKGMFVKMQKELEDDALEIKNAKIGDKISFVGNISTHEVLNSGGVFMFSYKNDIRYIAKTNSAKLINVTEMDKKLGFADSARELIKNTIKNNMDERYAGLSYAIFVGDLSGVDYDIVSNFRASGVAHLLAVSGLNTSIMAVVLVWLLGRLRIKPKYSVLIVAIILLFYCIICDFCASCLRASLMSVFLLLAHAFGKQNDSLNSVSLSGIILLLCCPMFVFDLSFILSYACVFGIIMLAPIFYKFFMKCKFGKFLSLNFSISLAAQITTLCLCINTFGYVSILSLLVNVVVCPIMEYVYILSFVALLLTLVFSFMGFLLWLCQWGLWLVDTITQFVASLRFSVLFVDKLSMLFLVWSFVAPYMFSQFVVLTNKKQKLLLYSGTAVCGLAFLGLSFL